MSFKQKKTISQKIKWWVNTRIVGFWRIKFSGYIKQKIAAEPDTVSFNRDASPYAITKQ